ncbi:MAG: serine/threonine protein kinase [Myxococcales bacterium]|nr:serine/threonine protein kinase [Myxococcales bacterium]
MAGTVELRQTFDQRWQELALAETAVAVDATITPEPAAWTRPVAEELPRISLSFSDADAEGAPTPAAVSRTDLEVRGVLGEGGMGRVHAARQHSLRREVAVKTVKERATASAAAAILREAVVTGALEHPGIVPVHALGLDDRGRPVLVMKRVEGVEWRALLHDAAHPAWSARGEDRMVAHLEILMQVCQAVHFAHTRGVVHRDIKPENVMLGDFGEVYLVDWGIALRLDDASERTGLVGTPAYMAPEMVAGRAVSPQTDVYLLGATLHEILTGQFRHFGESLQDVLLSAFCSDTPEYTDAVPKELAELCRRSMARDPEARPESALALRQALADFLGHRGSIALAESAGERLSALLELLAGAPAAEPPGDLARAYQLATESRFGFTQALSEWPENDAARAGLHRVLSALADLELRQGHAETAETLVKELDPPSPELAARVAAEKKKKARQQLEEKRLREMANDMDVRVAGKQRSRALAALLGASGAMAAFALMQPHPSRLKVQTLLSLALVLVLVMLAAVGVWRKQLMQNAFNRRLVGLMLLSGVSVVFTRFFGGALALPTPYIFALDSLVLCLVSAAATIVMLRGLWPLCVVMVASSALCLIHPSWSAIVFGFASTATVPLVALAIHLHKKQQEREGELPPESRV